MSESKTIYDGGPAFARSAAEHGHGGHYEQDGMSLRDWFAGQALVGILSTYSDDLVAWEKVSHRAFGIADAMITARKAGAA